MKRAPIAFLMLLVPAFASAFSTETWPGFIPMICDSTSAIPSSTQLKPGYLSYTRQPNYAIPFKRIVGDSNTAIPGVPGGVWGEISRHIYSKQQPWQWFANASDSGRIWITNKDPDFGIPTKLILNGDSTATGAYRPQGTLCGASALYDWRWVERNGAANYDIISINESGDTLSYWNAIPEASGCMSTALVSSLYLPTKVDGLGQGEGNPSRAGNLALSSNAAKKVWLAIRGYPQSSWPYYSLPSTCPLGPGNCTIATVSLSQQGQFVDVHYSGDSTWAADAHQILVLNPIGSALVPKVYTASNTPCDSFATAARAALGFIFPLKHADLAIASNGSYLEYLVGGRSCTGYQGAPMQTSVGRVVAVNLLTGVPFFLTNGGGGTTGLAVEASVAHVSARNTMRPGWVYVTYDSSGNTKRFSSEIVSIKIEGDRATHIQRWGKTRTSTGNLLGGYYAEAQAVPSWTGTMVMWASNWADPTGGDFGNKQAYVFDARVPGEKARAADIEKAAQLDRTIQTSRLYDVQGRRVIGRPASGVYFQKNVYRSGRVETKRVVIVR